MSHRKRVALAISLAAVTLAVPAAAGSAQPTSNSHVVKAIRGTCDIEPIGKQAVTAELAMTLPASVPAGTPVRAKDVKLKVLFSAQTVQAFKDKQITSFEGALGVQLKANDKQFPSRGPLERTAVPETGELTVELPLKSTVEVPTPQPGKVVFTVGPLEMLLAQVKALQEPTGEATPVACVPDEGQDTALGTVRVLDPVSTKVPAKPSPTVSSSTSAPAQSSSSHAAPPPKERKKQQAEPEPCQTIPPDAYNFWSYYDLSGHAEVRKLKSGIDFGPGYLSAQLFFWFENEIACGAVFGDLLWPPASGSFVAFGFMPTTAVVTVVPVERAEGRLQDGIFTGTAKVHLVLSNVKVNGTPLPVGPKCQTAEPVVMPLKSVPGEWDVFAGGTIETDVTIPPFQGCFGTENLDPLFTGLISGPGNHVKLKFGEIHFCEPPDKPCVPPLPGRR
ncbi:hypothetical protein SAMN05661093_05873 [Kibdelosporangium aridum]|uniref:DUF6801 domain-containing protein n=1 Tax=Kibdelosporangium aridum TaxID=2030 RepID=A0A1W2FAT3_KIBAR|nr:hypothetical protein SAMN05661093_05873 [Kibdelosporangium aridum]